MARSRPHLPTGHGEVLADPPCRDLGRDGLAGTERSSAPGALRSRAYLWRLRVSGRARRSSPMRVEFTEELGLPLGATGTELVVATGHQPDLFHPGIWVKDFLLQRLGDETGATAIDFVVDSDGFDAVKLSAPCMDPDVRVCEQHLAVGAKDTCYARERPPSAADVRAFCEAGSAGLSTLPAPAVARHFEAYCACLSDAAGARRRSRRPLSYWRAGSMSSPAGTDLSRGAGDAHVTEQSVPGTRRPHRSRRSSLRRGPQPRA